MQRRSFLAGTAGLTAAAHLARPALAQGEANQVLRFIPQADLSILDPLNTTAYPTRNHGHLCWDTLYGLDLDFRPQPQLAAGHTVEDDGKRWTFTLREGIRFHDNEPIRAADAVASIRRWMLRDTHGQTLSQRVEEIRALDDRRFEIRLKRPFGPMLDALAKASSYPCFIYPERFATQDPGRAFTEVVGSGPYRFVAEERVSGSQVVYRRFEGYKPAGGAVSLTAGPKLALFERLEWKHIPDPATAAAALQAGEVDWWEQVAPDLRPLLRRGRNITVDRLDFGGTVAMLRPNHLHPPFDNPALRRALLPAIRQADYMTAIMGDNRDLWREGIGCFPEGSPMASDAGMEALTGPRDFEAAKRAVQAAGYKGEKVVMLHPTDIVNNNNLTAVATDMLQRTGLNVESATSDWGTLLQRRANKNPPGQGGWSALIVLFGGMDLANPGGHPLLRANGQNAWFGWPTAPKLEELRDQWFDAPDLAAQQRIGREIQTQFFQDVPYYPLGQYLIDSAWRSNLTGHRKGMALPLNVKRA
ncbi:ABC transporter substrate-binding protein [Teichococcus aestuarii]|uniref:ABC transporter substrate-binding protein n=1 Tax=Teichococcus aestuarii TaxID=568898 RepID=A0A2U1V6B4_9PROT|nr:ABC transporter substrate-binding protein [Pseudoroseomonas aestuarii]PWC29450.1 ABC transporter substrate-binding protein [Pseudoroseomonas aestuarii]